MMTTTIQTTVNGHGVAVDTGRWLDDAKYIPQQTDKMLHLPLLIDTLWAFEQGGMDVRNLIGCAMDGLWDLRAIEVAWCDECKRPALECVCE